MAKLTRKQARELASTIDALDKSIAYIMKPEIAVARRGGDGSTLHEVTKEIGSDLASLFTARHRLVAFFDSNI